jgi:chemotaxis protein MotB
MATYSDMITLMLCFFVMMFAMSNVDASKFEALTESYARRTVIVQGGSGLLPGGKGLLPGNIGDGDLDRALSEADRMAAEQARALAATIQRMAADFDAVLAFYTANGKIAVDAMGDYVRITFPDGVLFDSGSAVLRPGAVEAIDAVADELLKYPGHKVGVEGHTDSRPISTAQYPSNRHLSSARADTVVEYLVNIKGFDPWLLSSEGMGEYFPVDTNDTQEGRANNRRVVIKVYAEQAARTGDLPPGE